MLKKEVMIVIRIAIGIAIRIKVPPSFIWLNPITVPIIEVMPVTK